MFSSKNPTPKYTDRSRRKSSLQCYVLIGAPAAGKTTTGRLLARRLGLPFIDIDERIATVEQKSIGQIFAEKGEDYFRKMEAETVANALRHRAVVALGGGAVVNPIIRHMISDHHVIWLQVDLTHALQRVGDGSSRPLLSGDVATKWTKLVESRLDLYAQCAHYQVITDDLGTEQVVAIISEIVRKNDDRCD